MAHDIRRLQLEGDQSLARAVDQVEDFLRQAAADGIKCVLVDVSGLTGFARPDALAHVEMVRRWASATRGRVRMAMIAPERLRDLDRIGVVVAQGLAFDGDVFDTEEDALQWLEQTPALWAGPMPPI